MLLPIFLSLTIILLFFTVFIPCHKARELKEKISSEDYFRLLKIQTVREYYPQLKDMSDREIALKIDYDDAYWKIR